MAIRLTRRERKVITVLLVMAYASPTVWVALVAFNIQLPLLNPKPQPESYSIAVGLRTGDQHLVQDILLGFTFTYTNAIAVNQTVNISATAELSTQNGQQFDQLYIVFQDGLQYPVLITNDIPMQGHMTLTRSNSKLPNILHGNATFVWNHEGTFSPVIIGVMKNGSRFDFGLVNSITVQVLPKRTLNEMQMNKLNLVVAYAILILSALGFVSTLIDLWIVQPSEKANNNPVTTTPSKDKTTARKPTRASTKKP